VNTAEITDGPDRDELQRALFNPRREISFSYLVDGKDRYDLRCQVRSVANDGGDGTHLTISGYSRDLKKPVTATYNPTTGKGTLCY
jgi:hypothetical protein